jgi:hypothetical protein
MAEPIRPRRAEPRRRSLRAVPFLAAPALVLASLTAQDLRPDPALRARFGFAASDVRKISDGVEGLRVVDLDRDGRDEIVVFDSERARFTILDAQDAAGGGLEYGERHVDSDGRVFGSVVCDLDGDGTHDLAFLDSRGRLVALAGAEASGRRRVLEVGPASRGDALRAGDLDGDGASELVVATQAGLRIVRGLLGDDPSVSEAVPLGERRFGFFGLHDLDGDGALDLCLGTDAPRTPFWVRLGNGKGGFGSWLLLPMEPFQCCFPGAGTGEKTTLNFVDRTQWRLTEYALGTSDEPAAPALLFESFETLKRGAFPFVQTDADRDGQLDLVLAHPDRAELVYLLERGGRFERRTVATLDDVDMLSAGDVDGDGIEDLVLVSSKENLVAWRSGTEPLDAFPDRLPLPAEVTALAAWVPAGRGGVDVLVRNKRREGALWHVGWGEDGAFALDENALVEKLDRLGGEPTRALQADYDGDGAVDVAFVIPGDGLWFLRGDGQGGYADQRTGEAGFTAKIEDGAVVALPKKTKDAGPAKLFVVQQRFARTVRLADDGQLDILDQENGPPSAQMALAAVRADGTRLYLDREANKLFRVAVGEPVRTIDVPAVGATHLLVQGDDVVILGRDGVVRVPHGRGHELVTMRSVGRLSDESRPFHGIAADLDSDGTNEAIVVDEEFNGVVVLVAGEDEWQPGLAFPVFEVGQKYDAIWEPDEMAAGDVDGDGELDLVLLCHDRVLVYRQGSKS